MILIAPPHALVDNQIMAQENPSADTLVLRPSRAQWLLNAGVLFAFFLGCGVIGLSTNIRGAWYLWALLILFGALALWSAVMAFSPRSRLELTRDGFTYYTPVAQGAYRWSDIDSFAHGTMNRRPTVFFKFAPGYTGKKPPLSSLSGVMSKGYEMYLPDTNGMTAEALARLLAEWQARSLSQA